MLYSPSVYRMMNKKSSNDNNSNRASSRDRASSSRKPLPVLPLDNETNQRLSLKEKLLLLHFHETEDPVDQPPPPQPQPQPPQPPPQDAVDQNLSGDPNMVSDQEMEEAQRLTNEDLIRNRKKFERSVTAPVLPINRTVSIPEDQAVKKRSNTLAEAITSTAAPTMPNRKKSEHGTSATAAVTRNKNLKQVIGGCCVKLKKVGQLVNMNAASTTSGSVRSGSGSG